MNPPEWMNEEDCERRSARACSSIDEMAARTGVNRSGIVVDGNNGPDRWTADLVLNAKGQPAGLPVNVSIILTHDKKWKGLVGYDELGDRIVWVRSPGRSYLSPASGDDVTRIDASIMRGYFLEEHGISVRDPDMWSGICAAAKVNSHNRLKDYLGSLSWDSVPRLTGWLQRYCSAAPSELTEDLGRKWLIAAVARGLSPGCQADNTLTMIGGQGAGKTTTLRILGGEFFKSGLGDLSSKDARLGLQGSWIIEIGEFGSFKGRSVDQVKDFITQTVDIYRPPYGKDQVARRRGCVFAATTNNDSFLCDPTGARRFWTVRTGNCDISALERDRDQLLAEAVHGYRGGEQWHATRDQEMELIEHNAEHEEEDPWAERLSDILELAGDDITTVNLLGKLGFDDDKMTSRDAKRLRICMMGLGWTPYRNKTSRGYTRPGLLL